MNSAIHPFKAGKWMAALVLATALPTAFAADNNKAAGPAATPTPQQPLPNPAAEQALKKHFQAIFSALEGKTAVPDAKNFTEEFNKQASSDQLKQVFAQVHQTVGDCHIAGQMRSPISYIGSYLLQCDKAFVPMDIAVEERAPYRVHSLLIRPSYNKP
ncbi:hypothetical protein [Comamonas sp. CMM02]|uniref:hypothetical protein n=1 Tax=Comamonas sp. CMM02 TaxID=2769307 RepID=UPI0017811FE6|nr:hypothetical protein [Comamonas sp. CMM02]MBD9402032.1 hypothetical protein [Comamonas sp. CMM02]